MPFTALYDACVLYPFALRDLLIELACTDLFDARWTQEIHDEWIRNVLANRPDLSTERLEITRKLMDKAVPGCLITGYEPLIDTLELPDANDRHVLAAAIHGNAQVIVTFNLKDFSAAALEPYGIEALHPDDFVLNLATQNAPSVANAIRACQTRFRNPPRLMKDHLARLERQGLIRTVEALAPILEGQEWEV